MSQTGHIIALVQNDRPVVSICGQESILRLQLLDLLGRDLAEQTQGREVCRIPERTNLSPEARP